MSAQADKFPPTGALSARLVQAVAAVQSGGIHIVGGVDVSREVLLVSRALTLAMRELSLDELVYIRRCIGLYCLAVSVEVLPLMALWSDDASGQAGGGKRSAPTACAAGVSFTYPDGNHGDNNTGGARG